MLADITVDEDNDVWIVFDEDLWPEDKELVQALAVAELLSVELNLAMIWRTIVCLAWFGGIDLQYLRILADVARRLRATWH